MDILNEILRAETRIRAYTRETMLAYSPYLSQLGRAKVYCKLENLQYTGSFKARGAMNKVLSLTAAARERGVVTASTGNHGAAVARSAQTVHATGLVFVPENASPVKVQAIERLGATVRYYGQDCMETEYYARQFAVEHELVYVPPYNDAQVIGGQGTIGLELTRQLERIGAVFVSLGGGGLISGIAGYLKAVQPDVQIIACSPENSQVMIQSVQAGKIMDVPSRPTLSDGTAGGVEAGSITFELCQELVDEYVTVTEAEIKESLRLFIETEHMLIEGAAAVAVAAYVKTRHRWAGQNVVIVICGGNISLEMLKQVLLD
ncbi:MAG: threonine/serine dehydratase [Anaerolineae bacterium]|nr:threonine/serine dehydratase [Anaerolineae bacterium]